MSGEKVQSNTPGSPGALAHRLEAAEVAHIEARRKARWASNERIRAVNDARDAGWSLGEIASALSAGRRRAGYDRPVSQKDVPAILACGYPEDEPESTPAA